MAVARVPASRKACQRLSQQRRITGGRPPWAIQGRPVSALPVQRRRCEPNGAACLQARAATYAIMLIH
jgi:hypothetical protein